MARLGYCLLWDFRGRDRNFCFGRGFPIGRIHGRTKINLWSRGTTSGEGSRIVFVPGTTTKVCLAPEIDEKF